jgi:hypothetical protein
MALKAEAARKADEAHRERVHTEIEADFEALAGMTRGEAAHVARLIAAGRIRVIAGAGSSATDKAIELTRFAKTVGADGASAATTNTPRRSIGQARRRGTADSRPSCNTHRACAFGPKRDASQPTEPPTTQRGGSSAHRQEAA